MSASNRVRVSPDATAQLDAMRPEVQRRAHAFIVELASDPLRRRMGRLDIGMLSWEGLAIWGHQEADFWIQYTEETDGSLTILSIWER